MEGPSHPNKRSLQSKCNDSVLSSILQLLDQPSSSRRTIGRAVQAELGHDTPYGKCLQNLNLPLKVGGEFKWTYSNPLAMLSLFTTCSVTFATLMSSTLRTHPCSLEHPWDVIFYTDEVTPGNFLSIDQSRKVHCFYFSFKQFGWHALSREDAWLCLGVLRSSIASTIQGGLSCVVGYIEISRGTHSKEM